ncbi:MAG: ammonium transporter [Acidimicrobiia bacterium]
MRRRLTIVMAAGAAALVGPLALPAAAQTVEEVATAVDNVWIVVAGILVMLMQAGFALVEAGFTRAKNAANIVMKNVMDFSVGGLIYWAVGFGLAYGGSTLGGFVGYGEFFFNNPDRSVEWFFQVVFAATAATIVSGAMAERTKFSAYLMYTPFITGLIYPVVTHWVWSGQGWLGDLGFIDFAGSGIVHLTGGMAALAGVLVIGPRLGKYDKDGNPQPIPGHSLLLGALGVFILWFGWYGFNGGSTLAAVGADFASVAVTTTLSAAAGGVAAMLVGWLYPLYGKPDVGLTLNGVLAGLVGITAGTANVTNLSAVIIGLVAGLIVVVSIVGLERIKIDDPVGAISVHGTAGIWGVLAVGLFEFEGGLFNGGGAELLGIQAIGVLAIAGWVFVTSTIVFRVLNAIWGLRVSEEEERAGLDHMEHGSLAYPEFQEQVAPPETLDPVS